MAIWPRHVFGGNFMLGLIITAIGTVLFVMYALGIAGDGAVLIAAAILITGGMIKAELSVIVNLLGNAYINVFGEYDECDCDDEGSDEEDE